MRRPFLNRSEHGEGLRSSEENKSSSLKVRLPDAGAKGQIGLTIRFLRASRIRKDPMQLELLYGFWGTKATGSFRCVRVAVFGQLRFADSVMRLRGIV